MRRGNQKMTSARSELENETISIENSDFMSLFDRNLQFDKREPRAYHYFIAYLIC